MNERRCERTSSADGSSRAPRWKSRAPAPTPPRRAQTPAPAPPPALRPFARRASTARSEQRDAGGSHPASATSSRRSHSRSRRRRSRRAVSRRACARRISSSLLPRPLSGKFLDLVLAGAEAISEKRNPGDTQAARAARSAGAAIRWSLELQQRPPDADPRALARTAGDCEALAHAGGPARGIRLRRLDRLPRPPPARRSPPPPPPPRAWVGRRPTTSTSAAFRGARTSNSPRALPPARRRCSCHCSAISRASSSRAHASASTAASLARCARCSAGPRWPPTLSPTTAPPTIPAGATRCRRGRGSAPPPPR